MGISYKQVLFNSVLIILLFFVYVGLRILLTSGDNFTVDGILISPRFGLLPLAVIGAGSALSIQTLQRVYQLPGTANASKRLFKSIALLIPLPLVFTCVSHLQDPVISENYQPITDFTIILFSLMMLLLELLWPGRKPLYVQMAFGSSLTFCVAVIAFIGSTGIVAFWGLAVAIFFWSSFYHASWMGRFFLIGSMLLGVFYLMNSPFFQIIALTSRLQPLMEGSLDITSVTSRAGYVLTFFDQLSVDPVFGNFLADEHIGLPEGTYIHSIILSILTHTGVLGFIIFSMILLTIALPRLRTLASVDKLAFLWALLFLGLGSLYAFFTWPPFWFFVGFLCIKPQYLEIYNS